MYFGPVEVRHWLVPGQEQVITYPHPNVKLTNGVASYLHRDHLGSVRAITDATGTKIESAIYKPFGEQTETLSPANLSPESKGWIGHRYDVGGGLQYLNARYYDPVLGVFLQPDWFEVLQPGVGTNRFSYSFNDPVNVSDPSGNGALKEFISRVVSAMVGSSSSSAARSAGEASLARGLRNWSQQGKALAWRQEKALVAAGGAGSRTWTAAQRAELLRTGRVSGFHANHINNYAHHPELAGVADNINFMTRTEHSGYHAAGGGYRQPTTGTLVDREALYRQQTGEGFSSSLQQSRTYSDVVSSTRSTVDAVLNSRTMRALDLFDPISWADMSMQSQGLPTITDQIDYWTRPSISPNGLPIVYCPTLMCT